MEQGIETEVQEGTVPQEEIAPERVPSETQEPLAEPASQTIGAEEYEALKNQHKEALEKLRNAESDMAGKSRAITRLAQERDAALQASNELLSQKMNIVARQQAGTLDETTGTAEQQLAKLDQLYAERKQLILHGQRVEEARGVIFETLQEAGIDPNGADPEVLQLQQNFNTVHEKGGSFEAVIAQASKVAMNKMKAQKTTQPDVEKIKEDIRRELQEEFKRSGVLKVDTAQGTAGVSNDAEFLKAYGLGLSNDHARAKKLMNK